MTFDHLSLKDGFLFLLSLCLLVLSVQPLIFLEELDCIILPLGPTQWALKWFPLLLIVLKTPQQALGVRMTAAPILAVGQVLRRPQSVTAHAARLIFFQRSGRDFLPATTCLFGSCSSVLILSSEVLLLLPELLESVPILSLCCQAHILPHVVWVSVP